MKQREKLLLGVVVIGVVLIGGLLFLGGESAPPPPPPMPPQQPQPQPQQPSPSQPPQEPPREQAEQTQQSQPKLAIDQLFKDYAKRTEAKTTPLPPSPPHLPVIPPFGGSGSSPIPVEMPKKEEDLTPISIYGITCEQECRASTNLGVLRVGSVVGSERVLSIDKGGIRTDKRFIPF